MTKQVKKIHGEVGFTPDQLKEIFQNLFDEREFFDLVALLCLSVTKMPLPDENISRLSNVLAKLRLGCPEQYQELFDDTAELFKLKMDTQFVDKVPRVDATDLH
jgi:hypothetical protein